MKIILLQDVYKKGVAGEVVEVAPGFARNYLIPRGMAMKATPGGLRQAENLRKNADMRRAERSKEFVKIAERIQGLEFYFGVRAGDTGKLYGSITPGDIADMLKQEIGIEIDRRRIGDRALRELGEFAVPVRLDAGLAPTLKVVIFREGHDPREGEAEAEPEAVETPLEAEVAPADEVVEEVEVAEEAPSE